MRILGIETSSARGSIALLEGSRVVAAGSRDQAGAHSEGIPPMIEEALASSGWPRRSLERLAVGIGPGSFTGLRIGIGLALGIAEGLQVPLVGVGSLRAMALAVPRSVGGLRCPLLDARRGELFVAVYTAAGDEVWAPAALPGTEVVAALRARFAEPLVVLGEPATALLEAGGSLPGVDVYRDPEADLPHAAWVARAALSAAADDAIRPLYVRDAVAELPAIPQNRLADEAH